MHTEEYLKVKQSFLENPRKLNQLSKDFNIPISDLINAFKQDYFYFRGGISPERVIQNHNAIEYWINHQSELVYSVAKKFNVVGETLMRNLRQLGYSPITQRDPKFNEHIFDSIDTEEKAYWLGFIYADGYISNSPISNDSDYIAYNFELGLSEKDYDHLVKFKNFLNCSKDIYTDSTIKSLNGNEQKEYKRCRLCLTNQHFWNTLNKLGCTPNKTKKCLFPQRSIFTKEKFIYDFIRGFIDGDGTLSYGNNGSKKIPQLSILGTYEMLLGISHYLGHNSINKVSDTDVILNLKYNGNKAVYLESLLYKNAKVYLDRKYEKYLEHCRFIEESIE